VANQWRVTARNQDVEYRFAVLLLWTVSNRPSFAIVLERRKSFVFFFFSCIKNRIILYFTIERSCAELDFGTTVLEEGPLLIFTWYRTRNTVHALFFGETRMLVFDRIQDK
jgi:hypothetical protein